MNCCIDGTNNILANNSSRVLCPILIKQKIPRPPNAFMLYANENRKTLAHLYPADSNKEISRRLGQTWKDLSLQEKNKYFQKAKDIDREHKRRYPGYVYNPKDARIRKAIRSTLRDRSIGASPMLPRPCIRRANTASSVDFHSSLIMANPLTQFEKQSSVWNGLYDFSAKGQFLTHNENSACFSNQPLLEKSNTLPSESRIKETDGPSTHYEASSALSLVSLNLIESNEEERKLFEKEKLCLEAAENYMEVEQYEEMMKGSYLPISSTKFVKDPELFTNNAEYHREYIIKYFNHIPDYETYNVTTEDGDTFPYVTIPNLMIRQNVAAVSSYK